MELKRLPCAIPWNRRHCQHLPLLRLLLFKAKGVFWISIGITFSCSNSKHKAKCPILYGRDNVHTRFHQLAVLSGPAQSGKTLVCQSLSPSSSCSVGSSEEEAQQENNHHQINCINYHSMEQLVVFSKMMMHVILGGLLLSLSPVDL